MTETKVTIAGLRELLYKASHKYGHVISAQEITKAQIELFAVARTTIPLLLEEIERLRETLRIISDAQEFRTIRDEHPAQCIDAGYITEAKNAIAQSLERLL